ncbi:MAG: bacillithiol biosynthesis deacetylase BshB1 [Terracidiphilus sp.]|nr:bacillithiol biosynthesis deacetylase BshB1 [Terracidiphilus sp.]
MAADTVSDFAAAMPATNADILAIAAHRDDVEQTCGGALLRMASRGLRTAVLDLTQGEAGTRGSAAERAQEAAEAARILGVGWRQALDLPDGAVENTLENRIKIVRVLRLLRPRVVILPYWQARHPDHAAVATLGYEACFLSGLAKVETGLPPHRPFKIVYASLYADVRPSFIVDITPFIEQRHAALMAYRSQYANQASGGGLFVPEEEIRERTFAEARHYGLLAGVRYGEPFVQKEVGLADDMTLLPVQSI